MTKYLEKVKNKMEGKKLRIYKNYVKNQYRKSSIPKKFKSIEPKKLKIDLSKSTTQKFITLRQKSQMGKLKKGGFFKSQRKKCKTLAKYKLPKIHSLNMVLTKNNLRTM